jgi:hypothetical protein
MAERHEVQQPLEIVTAAGEPALLMTLVSLVMPVMNLVMASCSYAARAWV